MSAFAVVGTPVPRVEGIAKVTGSARFTADVQLPGLLWGKVLRSAEPHARLVHVDVSRARRVPGVVAALCGADVGDLRTGVVLQDMPVLCSDRVRFVGDAVAAVAAETLEAAEAALAEIEVEYEPLPAVFDPQAALREDAPRLHPDLASYRGVPELPDIPNLQAQTLVQKGDVEAGFAESDHVFEHTFTTALAHQGYLEPRACVVRIGEDGVVSVWSSCKVPYRLRDLLADLFGLPRDRVVVERVSIGGDFGGKGAIGPEPIAYLLARASGRPVRIVQTYAEEFQAGNPRHPAIITVKTGVRQDGTLVARQMRIVMDGGAYAAHKLTPSLALPSVSRGLGPYRIPHTLIECRWAYTNNVPGGIARAPGQPQVVFAGESQMDIVAEALSLDPLELRLRNAIREGDTWPDKASFEGVMVAPTLELVKQASDWATPLPPNRGRGVAITERGIGAGQSGLVVTLHDDGRVTALSAVPDVGTGAFTVLRQIVAEELHVPLEAVTVLSGNTSEAPMDAGIGGSKSTYSFTVAAVEATTQLNQHLSEVAADRLECAVEDIEVVGSGYRVKGHPDSWVPTVELVAEAAARAGGTLEARSDGPGRRRAPHSCSVACVVEVEVDRETGAIRPVRVTAAHDVGFVINPQLLQAQVDGATVQGLGLALMEWMPIEQGRVGAANLSEYKMPCAADVPALKSVFVEGAPGPGPYQAKAVAELSNCPVPAAVANAIASASGVRVCDLPLTAEQLYRALQRSAAFSPD